MARQRWILWLLLAVVAVTAANLWFAFRKGRPVEQQPMPAPLEEAEATPEPSPTAGPTPTLPPGLPELGESDAFVRELARVLSAHPRFAEWLVTEDLVRRFVVVVDNVAEGVSPRKQLAFLEPKDHMLAVERDGKLVVDSRSWARYDAPAEVVASLDVPGTVELYGRLEPLVDLAYRELGYPEARFRDRLLRALDKLLAVPVVDGPIELDPKVATYELRDPRLRALDPAQKHFLRMGPVNVKRVQEKLRALRERIRDRETNKGD